MSAAHRKPNRRSTDRRRENDESSASRAYERYGDRRRKVIAIRRDAGRIAHTLTSGLEALGDGELCGLEDALRVVCDELDEQAARQP